jgi:Flp pilus assembly protein TadG
MRRLLSRLRREVRGVATIEFAIWSSLFFASMLVAMDFALWRTQQLRLGSAIEQGGVLAFTNRATLDNTIAQSIRTYVQTAATVTGGATPTVTVTCNGVSPCPAPASRTCACLSTSATGVNSFGAAATCGSSCAGGSTAGYYLQLRVSRPYQSAILPHAMLAGRAMVESVVVRLQ